MRHQLLKPNKKTKRTQKTWNLFGVNSLISKLAIWTKGWKNV